MEIKLRSCFKTDRTGRKQKYPSISDQTNIIAKKGSSTTFTTFYFTFFLSEHNIEWTFLKNTKWS